MTMSGSNSRRDRMAIAIGVVVLLYAFAAFLWVTGRSQAWDIARREYEREVKTLKREKALIADREHWEERAEEARQRMPHVDADERIEKTAARREREEFPSFRSFRLDFWKTLLVGMVDSLPRSRRHADGQLRRRKLHRRRHPRHCRRSE